MTKYTGINIGPIFSTIEMGRKPREIWAASYMFSFLMECIIETLLKQENIEIVSPAILKNDSTEKPLGVGLYPDRVFVKGEFCVEAVIKGALDSFAATTEMSINYPSIMHVTIECKDNINPITKLNQLLDCTELYQKTTNEASRNSVLKVIQKKEDSTLITEAMHQKKFKIPFLGEIATFKYEEVNEKQWKQICDSARGENAESANQEDQFYQNIKNDFKDYYRSHDKYICVVRADGDNMGKLISGLQSADKIKTISNNLLEYGKKVVDMIKDFGGLPIYAGGDDLFFIAPVVSTKSRNIFTLIDDIDKLYKENVDAKIADEDRGENKLHTSLSFGLSISYYKYPLYESNNKSIELLFGEAKSYPSKNAVAWEMRKNSGGGFSGCMTKNQDKDSVYCLFKKLLEVNVDETTISAVAHKLRNNMDLLEIIRHSHDMENRLQCFYDKYMEETGSNEYIAKTRSLLYGLISKHSESDIETLLTNMYGMLRLAKFINGEQDNE